MSRLRINNNQRGVVSLLAVTFTAILILLLTTAMTRLMVGELRQSTDAGDSVKAYYIAQGAAENQAAALKKGVQDCSTQPSASTCIGNLSQGCDKAQNDPITCIKVGTQLKGVDSQLCIQGDTACSGLSSATFDLTNAIPDISGYVSRIVISWDSLAVPSPTPQSFTDTVGNDLEGRPAAASATEPAQPPIIEAAVSNFYPGQNTNINTATSGSNFLIPRCNKGTGNSCILPASSSFNFQTALSQAKMQVYCGAQNGNRCQAEITNLSGDLSGAAGYRTVLRLQTFYKSAKFSMKVYAKSSVTGGAEQEVAISPDRAPVDVTVNVGQTFRRVHMEVPIRSSIDSLGDVLHGDNDICKSFDILSIPGFEEARQPLADGPQCAIQ